MIITLHSESTQEKYVQVSVMARRDWGNGEWGEPAAECECGNSAPPTFLLPPPPLPTQRRPGDSKPMLAVEEHPWDCQEPFTCQALVWAREDPRNLTSRAPLAVVIVSAVTLVVLVIVATVILCRVRGRGRTSKGCTELSGAIIYDDLPSAPPITPTRTWPRFKPVPMDGEELGMTMGVHLYTPEPCKGPLSEHLYQSISSGSETCSYSTSEVAGQDGQALLRAKPYSHQGRTSTHANTDSEEEPLTHTGNVLGAPSDNDTPSDSPSHSHYYYYPSAPPASTSSPSSNCDSVYYVGGMRRGRQSLPIQQQRDLPPLPSRNDRFKIYFPGDQSQRRTFLRQASNRRHGVQGQQLPPEAEPLCENHS